MKALTIRQPWASLIALGYKPIENRGRNFRHRGPLAIHAGLRDDPAGYELAAQLGIELPEELPHGAVVAVAELVDCVPYGEQLAAEPFATGPYCLMLDRVRPFDEPVPYTGRQGMFTIPDELLEH